MTPRRRTNQDRHVNQSRETDGEAGDEEALVRMTEYSREDVGMEGVAQDGNEGEEEEEGEVEDEEDVGEDVEPVGVVGELVERDGDDAGGHGDDEPSVTVSINYFY